MSGSGAADAVESEGGRPTMPLTGRGAVVTGGGRGIGAAIARALVQAGADVVVAARTESEVRAVAAALEEGGGRARGVSCDVTEEESVAALAREAAAALDGVDILVTAAGMASSAPLHRLSLEEWERVLRVNATGTFLCLRAFLPEMVRRGWGRAVAVASVAGLEGAPYISAYAASKHAVLGLVRSVSAETAGSGVAVNAVCPGYVDTAMTEQTVDRIVRRTGRSREEALRAVLETAGQSRLLAPEEVAEEVLALCSEIDGARTGRAVRLRAG